MSTARCVMALVLLAACTASVVPGCKGRQGLVKGELAPPFVLPRLDGSVQKLSNYRGRAVLVNMWATWCPPCIEELPLLNQIAEEYGPRGLVVLGVAGDEDRSAVERFVAAEKPAFEVLLDPGGTVGTQYGITGYPETFLVDREGRVREKFIGPLPVVGGKPAPEVAGALEALLGG